MKKGAAILVVVLLFCLINIVNAAMNETAEDKITKAYDCLEDKVDDCSRLSIKEMALTILSTPDSVYDDCINQLLERKVNGNWGNIDDTAIAILALRHAGENTKEVEDWISKQNITATDLAWYLQQDSNQEAECNIGYNSKDYTIKINEDKKIDDNAGPCLSLAQSNFWLKIDKDCYDKVFLIECDQDFMANLIYKNEYSATIYALDSTQSAPAYDSIELGVMGRCFGKDAKDSKCNYESTLWAAIALQESGYDISSYLPYIVAMASVNKGYLPSAFVYMLTDYEEYANKLLQKQELGGYWKVESTKHGKYYDTSMALLSLSNSNSDRLEDARDWLLFSQGTKGCWDNSIEDTALVLWALEGRSGRAISGGSTAHCSDAGYFCIESATCPSTENAGNSYYCPSLSDTCCISENLRTCSEYEGHVCDSNKICTGNSKQASDTDKCCTGTCEDAIENDNECEENYYTCRSECSDYQEEIDSYECGGSQVCCRTATKTESSSWLLWALMIIIIIVLIVIGYIYREQLKLYLFQLKDKFQKDGDATNSGSPGNPSSGIPPRPGFPPIRRTPMIRQRSSLQKKKSYDKHESALTETFRKLKEMSN
jgi:hypothetical protein